jgi:hypothetical protein
MLMFILQPSTIEFDGMLFDNIQVSNTNYYKPCSYLLCPGAISIINSEYKNLNAYLMTIAGGGTCTVDNITVSDSTIPCIGSF